MQPLFVQKLIMLEIFLKNVKKRQSWICHVYQMYDKKVARIKAQALATYCET